MHGDPRPPWLTRWLERCGLQALIERFHQEHERRSAIQAERTFSSIGLLHGCRASIAYPLLVATLAMISAGTGLYPVGPVLVAAVVFAPDRWRSTYIAAAIGAATGAMLLAYAVQTFGPQLLAEFVPSLEHEAQWSRIEQWVADYGSVALGVIAGLPVPEIPPLLIVALAKTPPPIIGLAIFCGKLFKYGLYIYLVRLVLRIFALRTRGAR